MTMAAMPKGEEDFQAESDLRALIEAEKIKKDKKRMSAAMKKHKEMMTAMSSIEKKTDG